MTATEDLNYTKYRLMCLEKLAAMPETHSADDRFGWTPVEFDVWINSQANPEFKWKRPHTGLVLVCEFYLDDAPCTFDPATVRPLFNLTLRGKQGPHDFLCTNGHHAKYDGGDCYVETSVPVRSWRMEERAGE